MAAVAVDSSAAVSVSASTGTARSLLVYNVGPNSVYFGESSAVTSATGVPLTLGGYLSLTMGENSVVYVICASAETAVLRTLVGVA